MRVFSIVFFTAVLPAQISMPPRVNFDPSQQIQAPQEAPAGKGVLSGKVVNAKTKEPLKKANVQLNGVTNLSAVTDGSGAFTFRALPPGGYVVSANHEDFYINPGSMNMAQQITLAEGQEKNDAEIDLMPGASINGRVLDDDELPVPRCTVMAMRFNSNQGRSQFMNTGSGTTDEQGRFHLQNLQQGRYVFKAQCRTTFPAAHGFMKRNDPMIPQEGYASVVAGAGDPATSAAGMPVAAGAELSGIDFHVKRVPVFLVRGVVEGVEQNLLPTMQVFLTPADSTGEENITPAAYDASHGQFTFRHVPAGSYELTATLMNPERASQGRQMIEVGKTAITEFDLKLAAGATITGSLELDDPNIHFDNMQLSLQPLDPNYRGMVPIATLNADGSFEFKSVLPGRFAVNPVPMGYIKTVTLAGRDVNPQEFDITGAGSGPLHITVGSKMAKIEVDLSPKPTAGQMISGILLPDGIASMRGGNVAMSNPTGEVSFQGVPPGKYHAFILSTPNAWNLMNEPQILKSLDSHSVAVEVAEGDDKHISATAVSPEELQKALDAE